MFRTIGTLTVVDTPEARAIERALKEEAGALDMLVTCSCVSGGTRWYRLDGPTYVDPSRVGVLLERMREREASAAIDRWARLRCPRCESERGASARQVGLACCRQCGAIMREQRADYAPE